MLYEISRDPLAAQYVESLNLWDRRQLITDNFEDFRANGEAIEGIKDMAIGSECLDNASVNADDWWGEITKEDKVGDENALYIAVSLLSQLPNVKTLQ